MRNKCEWKEGCTEFVHARGLCDNHYRWTQRNIGFASLPSSRERFLAFVNKNGKIPEARPDLGPCWLWTGCLDNDGYGRFTLDGKKIMAARAAIILFGKGITVGLEPDHLCRVRPCVRVSHLEPVTHRENLKRGVFPNSKKLVCPAGHPLLGPNLYVSPTKRRICRICVKASARRSYRRKISTKKSTG